MVHPEPQRPVRRRGGEEFFGRRAQRVELTLYDPWPAYGQSKTANILFAVEASKRWESAGIVVNALHPDAIRTILQRHVTDEELNRLRTATGGGQFVWKTPEQGAATSVLVATSLQLENAGGRCFEDCNEAQPHVPGTRRGVADHASTRRPLPASGSCRRRRSAVGGAAALQ